MKLFNRGSGKRLSRHTFWFAVTALVIAAVIGLNVVFSALAKNNLWFVDMTTYTRYSSSTNSAGEKVQVGTDYEFYTLSEGCISFLDENLSELAAARQNKGEEAVKVDIIFCDDPDNLLKGTYSRYVLLTALRLAEAFPDIISVSYIDVYKNPSAVQKYKNNSFTTVYASNVIVASGSEYRRISLNDFFTFSDDTDTEPWAYSGEKRFCSAILAVTKAAAPIACLITNHGETGYSDSFIALLEDAGYEIISDFNLETDEVPEDCRLMVCSAPLTDYVGYPQIKAGTASVSEIAKLDAFLDDENSLMVFFNSDTPVLPNFEEYLEKWGISIQRSADLTGEETNYLLRDSGTSLTADGLTVVADYVTTGMGKTLTSDLQSLTYPAKVVFRNATSFAASPLYKTTYVVPDDENGVTEQYSYGTYAIDGVYRSVYDIFLASDTAEATVNGEALEKKADTTYKLMTMASETSTEPGDRNGYTTVSHNSYVLCCASTDFLCDELLGTNSYGNADMLSGILRSLGSDTMAARIEQYLKPFHSDDITEDYITDSFKEGWTLTLALVPAVLFFGLGIFVLVRRKYE